MNRIEELMIEIDGKVSYADSTGNCSDREELLEARRTLELVNISREFKDLEVCGTCNRGGFFQCGCKPFMMLNGRVIKCNSHRRDNGKV